MGPIFIVCRVLNYDTEYPKITEILQQMGIQFSFLEYLKRNLSSECELDKQSTCSEW